jgi:dienelactone hydrolase
MAKSHHMNRGLFTFAWLVVHADIQETPEKVRHLGYSLGGNFALRAAAAPEVGLSLQVVFVL